jgi:DNA polymerase III subunit delta
MKYTNMRAFEKHLEGASPKHFANVYMVLSKESFARKVATDRLLGSLLAGKKNPELCFKVLSGENLTIENIFEELHGLTFFTEHQIFLIENADKAEKPVIKAIEEYLAKPSPSLCLIISAAAINHSTNFYKKTEKIGIVLEIEEEKGKVKEKTMMEWVVSTISVSGKKIDPKACQHLIKQVGTDMALLHNEVQKLLCYIGDRPEVTVKDVGAICARINLENAWQLGEAIFNRDAPAALRISKALMDDGTSFLSLLRQIRHQFQTDYQVCTIMANGGSSYDISQKFPYMKGFILDRHLQSAQAYGPMRFKKGMQKIDELEIKAKNSGTDEDLLTELLIINLIM